MYERNGHEQEHDAPLKRVSFPMPSPSPSDGEPSPPASPECLSLRMKATEWYLSCADEEKCLVSSRFDGYVCNRCSTVSAVHKHGLGETQGPVFPHFCPWNQNLARGTRGGGYFSSCHMTPHTAHPSCLCCGLSIYKKYLADRSRPRSGMAEGYKLASALLGWISCVIVVSCPWDVPRICYSAHSQSMNDRQRDTTPEICPAA